MAESLRPKAMKQLQNLGVEIRVGEPVTQIDDDGVVIGQERIRAETVLWAAGVAASPLAKDLGAKLDRAGRVFVESDCSIAGHPEVFVVGDLMNFQHGGLDKPLPGVCQTAMQSGTHAALSIRGDLKGQPRKPFHYWDKGTLATIGRTRAVADLNYGIRLGGFMAWLIWVFVHILFLIGFRNRAVVMTKWAIAWFDFDRGSRLIWRADPDGAVPTPPPRRPSHPVAPPREVTAAEAPSEGAVVEGPPPR
jgi:NADH dehydrogenase